MTTDQVLQAVGVAITLLFSYFPKVKAWFLALLPAQQGFFMAGITLIVSLYPLATSCLLPLGTVCTPDQWWTGAGAAFALWVKVLSANQIAYLVTRRHAHSLIKAKA